MTLNSTTVREFNWLSRYLVSKTDLQNFQTWLQAWAGIAAQQTGLAGVIISGLDVTTTNPAPGTTAFTVEAGFGTDDKGKPLILAAQTVYTNTATYANNIKGILSLQFLGTNLTNTTTEAETGYLHTGYGAQLVLTMGTAAASPVYPAMPTGLILGGYTFNSSGVLTASDYSFKSRPRIGIKGNKYWTNSQTNPTSILAGEQLTHYELTLTANLTVDGTLITGNLTTTGFTLDSTGGTVVNQY
jgi:hypothetical protein